MDEIIKSTLKQFEPITLAEMDSVKLMDRTDTKYTFNIEYLPLFLESMKDSYRVLDVNGCRINSYQSLYFDTSDFRLYNDHLTGKMNRYKIRFRSYVESNLHFFEIKYKNNKGRTIKNRIEHQYKENRIDTTAEQFLKEHTPIDPECLEKKFNVGFSRITFVNRFTPERVTIDTNMSFTNGKESKQFENLVVAEVKQSKHFVSAFVRLMKDHHVREGALSKYCYGVMCLFTSLRFNNFKPQLLLLNKLTYDPVTRA